MNQLRKIEKLKSNKMKIALFCSAKNRVPPLKTGGTEQPVYYLAKILAERGHDVVLYAAHGSLVPGVRVKEISPFVTAQNRRNLSLERDVTNFYDLAALGYFFRHDSKYFDVIQFNSYVFYEILPFAPSTEKPIIIRINYPHDKIYPYIKSKLNFPNVYYLPISHFIKSMMPGLNYLPPIPPAVDFNDFLFNAKPKDYYLFIGRLCPEKGAHLAIAAARKAKKKLIIAGRIEHDDPADYFNKLIKPQIDNKKVIYIGEADFKTKLKLYQGALATLFPVQWNEPFGNVMIESMACGTPVIAFKRAACSEAVKDGLTGRLVKDGDIKAMTEAMTEVVNYNRKKIRFWAKKKYYINVVAGLYEKIYRSIVK